MTNLEFIEILIEKTKKQIELHTMAVNSIHSVDFIDFHKENLKENKIKLQILEQIKTDLEAWEVVKLKEVDLYDVIHTTNYKQYESENVDLLKQYFLTQQEYEKIKKALEVEDA